MTRHPGEWGLVGAAVLGVAGLVAVPLILVVGAVRGLWAAGSQALAPVAMALAGSLGLALVVGVICLVLTAAAAVWLELEVRASIRPGLQTLVVSMVGLPSVVVGFVGVTLLRPLLDVPDAILLVGLLVVMAMPHTVGRALRAIRTVPAVQIDAARALGAERELILRLLVLPAALPGLVAAALVGGLRALGDTVVVLLLVGAEGSLRTLTTGIVHHAGGPTAPSMALLLGLVAASMTLAAHRLARGDL